MVFQASRKVHMGLSGLCPGSRRALRGLYEDIDSVFMVLVSNHTGSIRAL